MVDFKLEKNAVEHRINLALEKSAFISRLLYQYFAC